MRFVGASFMYNGNSICGLKLRQAGGGFSLRKGNGRRPHLYIPLDSVVADGVSDPQPDELGDIEGDIADDDAVMFALPRVIEGQSQAALQNQPGLTTQPNRFQRQGHQRGGSQGSPFFVAQRAAAPWPAIFCH